ncbi:MAG TPA: hypothetical protein VMA54_08010 [Steroidobacteraceae bacterium]|nr:hypothetical protein [Steroidobacteraceae bacterium]
MHIDSLVEATVAVAFWVFLTVSAYAAIKYDFRKRQLAMESLRAAIERGQPLEPAVVEHILARHSGSAGEDAEDLVPYLQIGGIITIAGGIGVFIAAFFVGLQFPIAKLPMLGAGVLAVCIGVGLLVASRVLGRCGSRRGSPDSVA